MRRSSTLRRALSSVAILTTLVVGVAGPVAARASTEASVSTSSAAPGSPASANRVLDRTISRGQTGTLAGRRPARHVTVKDLPKATGHERTYQPRTLKGTSWSSPSTRQPGGLAAPAAAAVTTTNPATEATAADGITDATLEPPDPFIAVGPDHVIQSTNAGMRISDRSLDAVSGFEQVSLTAFFGIDDVPDYDAEAFDPRISFDVAHNRWIASEASFDCYPDPSSGIDVGTGYIDIAISDTADPTLGWEIISLPYFDLLPDYPGLGTSTDKVVASANVYGLVFTGTGLGCAPNGAQFFGTELDVLGWQQLLGTGDINWSAFRSFGTGHFGSGAADYYAFRPTLQQPAITAPAFGVAIHASAGGDVAWFRITGLPASNNTTLQLGDVAGLDPFQDTLPQPAQPGAPGTIGTGANPALDGRPTDAIWQSNRLVFVSTIGCDPAGGAVETRDCVRVTEISIAASSTAPSIKQDFIVSESGRDLYMGGVGLSGNSDLHVVWTGSSATAGDFTSTYTAYQASGAANNSLAGKQEIANGGDTYAGGRWGDYNGIAQDPRVPDAVWQADEIGDSAGWATHVSQLRTFGGASYVAITPLRVLDSRGSTGGAAGGFSASVPKTFPVTGVGTIPSNAIGVTGNVTVVGQQAAGYVAVTPNAITNPTSSTINFPVGDVRANNFTLPLGTAGKLSAVYKAPTGKKTHVIVDITGYFTAGSSNGTYTTVTPSRILDSRGTGVGLTGKFNAGTGRSLQVTGAGNVPAGATAITGNLTVVNQQAAGYLSVTPDVPVGVPASSSLNFPVGDVRANGLTAALNGAGQLAITYTAPAGKTADVILDVTGYYAAGGGGLLFYPLSPGRLLDSRSSVLTAFHGKFAGGVPHGIPTSTHQGVAAGAQAMTGNLTVVNQTRAGYVADTPTPTATPTTSTINFPVGDIRANGVTVPLATGSQALVYIGGSGTTDLILDVTGYFK